MTTAPVEPVYAPVATQRLPAAFHRFVASSFGAHLAEQVGLAIAPIVAVISFGAGAGGTGALQVSHTLPFLLLSIPAGVLADRSSRHRLMMMAESVRLVALLIILVLVLTDHLTLLLLATLGFIGTTGTVVYSVCSPALTPALVNRSQLGAANARLEVVRSMALMAGPTAGGALAGWLGASWSYGLAALLSGAALMWLRGIREPSLPSAVRHPLTDLREGAHFLFGNALLRPLLGTAVVFNTAYFVVMGIFAVYAHDHLGLGAGAIGLLLATNGVGLFAGAMFSGQVLRRLRFGSALCIGPSAALIAAILLAATIWVPTPLLAGVAFFLLGAGPAIWTIASTTLRQTITPDAMLGRVSSVIMTATFGARPVGAAIGGVVGAMVSPAACLIVAVAGFAIQFGIIVRSAPARLTDLPDSSQLSEVQTT